MTAPDGIRVLVVEDEAALRATLAEGLQSDGFRVEAVNDGPAALEAGLTRAYDVIVLDLMLPGLSAPDMRARLREAGVQTPVLVLTARTTENDQLWTLGTGADDILAKPLSYHVLLARLDVLLRRTGRRRATVLTAGDLSLDRASRRCRRGEIDVDLTPREFGLLDLLMSRAGQVVPKRQALDEVWSPAMPDTSNVLEVYVCYLRRKVDQPFRRRAIGTVRGIGYRLDPDGG